MAEVYDMTGMYSEPDKTKYVLLLGCTVPFVLITMRDHLRDHHFWFRLGSATQRSVKNPDEYPEQWLNGQGFCLYEKFNIEWTTLSVILETLKDCVSYLEYDRLHRDEEYPDVRPRENETGTQMEAREAMERESE